MLCRYTASAMCRLLGVVASERTDFRVVLRDAPRSLALLSHQHPHGWGIAVYDSDTGWTLLKHAARAADDARFHEMAAGSRGTLLVAHVRQRTVGPVTVENTHPFRRGRWVFAHNGTIEDQDYLHAHASPERLAEIEGQTDSELFFAYLLTRLDRAGVTTEGASATTDAALLGAMREALARPSFGACNFLLTDGETLYAHRFGRTLFVLERGPRDAVRERRVSAETGALIETPWSPRRRAVLIASERITEEPWQELPEGALVRADRVGSSCEIFASTV